MHWEYGRFNVDVSAAKSFRLVLWLGADEGCEGESWGLTIWLGWAGFSVSWNTES